MNKPSLLVFDVNETLLDMTQLKSAINSRLFHSSAFDIWFAYLLQYAWVESLTGKHRSFSEIAGATLGMTAEKLDCKITQSEINVLLSKIKTLPPHKDVIGGLVSFQELGIPMVALTNGSLETANAQMEYSGIGKFMKRIFSIDEVGYFKPHPSPYQFVLNELKLASSDVMMIACHPWDLLGAKRVGLQTCLIRRKGMPAYPFSEPVDLEIESLKDLHKYFES
ncbi:haloacid dehalogenase type II [Belliella aquatica]|nr:haloacid dehalogenase type II [Belliella aquatica]MCH7407244.1 haloacid dehalogenase type II [Belliella aquatica]